MQISKKVEFELMTKKRFIVIYVYTFFSEEETVFWENVNYQLSEKDYHLFLLVPVSPQRKVAFKYELFDEKLEDVNCISSARYKSKLRGNLKEYLKRESLWYGESKKDRKKAIYTQNLKYDSLIKQLNPSLLVLGNGNHTGELILKDIALYYKIPTIFIERGSLPKSWHLDDFGMTAGTSIARTEIDEIKIYNNYLFNRYKKYYLESKFTWWKQPDANATKDIRARFNLLKNTRIILFGNQLNNDTSNFLYNPIFKSNEDAFDWFCRTLKAYKEDLFVLVKKHPHFQGEKIKFIQSLQKHSIKGAWVEDVDVFECLKQSNLVCAVNSTLLFEALIYEKPVLQLGLSILSNKNIVYQINSLKDDFKIAQWIEHKDFQNRLLNYEKLMSYMILNDLNFFFEGAETMGLNGVNDFVEKSISKVNPNNQGVEPKRFMKLNNNKSSSLGNKIKYSLKKFFK